MPVRNVTFTHHGRTFHCHVDMGGEYPLARPSEAVWVVEVDGESHAPFDASPDDTRDSLVRRVIAWFEARPPR